MRLKKSLRFIQEVIRSYETGVFSHVGFSCALAISKAEELRDQISPSSKAWQLFGELAETLHELYEGRDVFRRVQEYLNTIRDYFKLDRYSIIPHDKTRLESSIAV